MWRLSMIAVMLSCVLSATGCSQTGISRRSLSELKLAVGRLEHGASLRQVEEAFGARAAFQFKTLREGEEYLCVSFVLGGRYSFWSECYVLFKHAGMGSLMEAPPFEFEDDLKNRISRRKPWSPIARVDDVLCARDYTGATTTELLKKRYPEPFDITKSNLGPLVPLLLILDVFDAPKQALYQHTCEQYERKFDPFICPLDVGKEELIKLYGQPLKSAEHESREYILFGPERSDLPDKLDVLVVVEDGVVRYAFSNDFVNLDVFYGAGGEHGPWTAFTPTP